MLGLVYCGYGVFLVGWLVVLKCFSIDGGRCCGLCWLCGLWWGLFVSCVLFDV